MFVISGTGSSIYSTVTATSQQLVLVAEQCYLISSNVGCWIALGASPTAIAGAASMTYVGPNHPIAVQVLGALNRLAIIRDGAVDGKVSASLLV